MKLASLLDSLTEDIRAVASHFNVNVAAADGGKSGLKTMHALLDIVSKNRAYDDSHPGFSSGAWPRILPHDGRDYCWYYEGGCDDTHVATLLKKIKTTLSA